MSKKQSIWITKDGTKILVKNMTDSHILNCISGLKERKIYPLKQTKRLKWLEIFNREIRFRKYKKLMI
jgi:hypothetical protein